ncbi:MAG: GyrI-like domain-containing protein [Armatimonadetes bacterium]|nr:GyrI-like domain-containing protein [Armatimonadota bacterium]
MQVEFVDCEECVALVSGATCGHAELGPVITGLFQKLVEANPEAVLISFPRVYYTLWEKESCAVEAAFPVEETTVPGGGTQLKTYPGGRAVMATHVGPYDTMSETWMALWEWVSENKQQPAEAPPWDVYVTDPGQEPDPLKWVTEIYIPLVG